MYGDVPRGLCEGGVLMSVGNEGLLNGGMEEYVNKEKTQLRHESALGTVCAWIMTYHMAGRLDWV